MRCSPSMRISPTVNSLVSIWAWAAGTASTAGMAAQMVRRIIDNSAEQPRKIVVERKAHQHEQQHDADLLADRLCPLRQRTALRELGELIDDLPAVEDRDRQQVQHEKAHAHD